MSNTIEGRPEDCHPFTYNFVKQLHEEGAPVPREMLQRCGLVKTEPVEEGAYSSGVGFRAKREHEEILDRFVERPVPSQTQVEENIRQRIADVAIVADVAPKMLMGLGMTPMTPLDSQQ